MGFPAPEIDTGRHEDSVIVSHRIVCGLDFNICQNAERMYVTHLRRSRRCVGIAKGTHHFFLLLWSVVQLNITGSASDLNGHQFFLIATSGRTGFSLHSSFFGGSCGYLERNFLVLVTE